MAKEITIVYKKQPSNKNNPSPHAFSREISEDTALKSIYMYMYTTNKISSSYEVIPVQIVPLIGHIVDEEKCPVV